MSGVAKSRFGRPSADAPCPFPSRARGGRPDPVVARTHFLLRAATNSRFLARARARFREGTSRRFSCVFSRALALGRLMEAS